MNVKKRAFILAFLGIIFSFIAYLLLELSWRYQLVILLAGLLTSEVVILLAFGAIICFWMCIHIILKHIRARYLRFTILTRVSSFLVTGIAVFLCLIMIFVGIFDETHRFVLKSPDNKHTIVVTEGYSLHHGGGAFYERVNPLFVMPIGSFTAGNVYRPFTNGEYTVEWFDDGLRIKYLFDLPQIYKEERLYYQEEDFNNYIKGSID